MDLAKGEQKMTLDISAYSGVPLRTGNNSPSRSPLKPGETESEQEIKALDKADPSAYLSKTAQTKADQGQPAQAQDLQQAVDNLKELVQSVKRNLEFSIDSDSGRYVIKVIDAETDKVVRQIPPEEVLRISRSFKDSLGALIRLEA
jgi:flagellar protein FlaG